MITGPAEVAHPSPQPTKPIMVAETASTEFGGSKAHWIRMALRTLPTRFPQIKAFLWFDWNADNEDWTIGSSPAATAAFAASIAAPYFASNTFSRLRASPIEPIPPHARTG